MRPQPLDEALLAIPGPPESSPRQSCVEKGKPKMYQASVPMELLEPNVARLEQVVMEVDMPLEFPRSPQDTLLKARRRSRINKRTNRDLADSESTSCGSSSSQEEEFHDSGCSSPCDSFMIQQKRRRSYLARSECTAAASQPEMPSSPLDSLLLQRRRLRQFQNAGA
jgi:hypothetical protein